MNVISNNGGEKMKSDLSPVHIYWRSAADLLAAVERHERV
jgi:hypothetical protein